MPQAKKAPTKTLEVPAAMTKLLESCRKTHRLLTHKVCDGQSRALGQIRPTCNALELLRQVHSPVRGLLLAAAEMSKTLNDAFPLAEQATQTTTELPPPPVVNQPSLTRPPYRALAACPRCGAVVLAVDATEPDLRRRMTDEARRLKKICSRALPSPQLRGSVEAYIRALDLSKPMPETMEFLRRLRSALGDLLAALFDWNKPLEDVLDAADKVDRDPSELPSFVLSAEGLIDVQRRQPCEHLLDVGFVWSMTEHGPVPSRSTYGPVEWLRPTGFGCAERMHKQQSLSRGFERFDRRKKYSEGHVEWVQFYGTGNNKDERPVGLGFYGEAYFVSEE